MLKAVREAKVHTSWLTPNQQYEDALKAFVERVLTGDGATTFPAGDARRCRTGSPPIGMVNSLSQVVVKLGSPGVPDFYQGTELWDLSLVDPDNRRPVDFDRRQRLLDEVDRLLGAAPQPSGRRRLPRCSANWRDGRIKLLITAAGLRLRRDEARAVPRRRLRAARDRASRSQGNAIAFARLLGEDGVLFVGAAPVRPAVRHRSPAAARRVVEDVARAAAAARSPAARSGTRSPAPRSGRRSPAIRRGCFLGQIFEHVPVGILRVT